MKTALWLACALLLAVSTVGLARDDNAKIDKAKLVGDWKIVAGQKDGAKIDEDRLKGQSFKITKDTLTLKGEGGTFVMKFEIDDQKKPAAISMTMTESPFGAGATAKGIIELKDDELKLCYAPMGDAPTKFEAKEGSKHHFFTLKRAK